MFESNTDIDEAFLNIPFEFNDNTSNKPDAILPVPVQLNNDYKGSPIKSPAKTVVSRKFPGPAGLLPDRKALVAVNLHTREDASHVKKTKDVDMDVFCSQATANVFENNVWLRMEKDYELFLLDKYNIAWVKSRAFNSKLINQKAPFLAAVIQSMEVLKMKTPFIKITLKDRTDSIHGMLVQELYEEYRDDLIIGSVVVLKQFGVLTTDESKHYINICPNNLVAIYSNAKVVSLQQFTSTDILKSINETRSRHKALSLQQKLNPSMNNFNNTSLRFQSESNNVNPGGQIDVNCTRFKYDNLPNFRNPQFASPKSGARAPQGAKIGKFNFKACKESCNSTIPNTATNNIQQEARNGSKVEDNLNLQNIFEGIDTDLLFGDF